MPSLGALEDRVEPPNRESKPQNLKSKELGRAGDAAGVINSDKGSEPHHLSLGAAGLRSELY